LTDTACREDNSRTIPLCDVAVKKIVLASASPRRRGLLEQIGLRFQVEPTEYDEETTSASDAHEMARELSLGKARAAARKRRKALIIAADTLVVLGGRVFGKPHTNDEAKQTLRALNGRTHSVITGFTILDNETGKVLSRSVETKVQMRKLTLKEIDGYVRTREPLDKAGGYAIQGRGVVLVEKIEGDYSNVVGLPLTALAESLKEFGINVP
jgi:septum formation protein